MSEREHFDLPAIFHGAHVYTQIAAYSERFAPLRFAGGAEINYHRVNLEAAPAELRPEMRWLVAELIHRELEIPSFLPQSADMPYDVPTFEKLMGIPDTVVLLAWSKNSKNAPQLVGYLIGGPYKNYPNDLKADFQHDATLGGRRLVSVPDDTTWMFDTFAVREDQRGLKIGENLLELMLQQVVYPGSPYDKVATFAVNHATAHTRKMVLKHRYLNGHALVDEVGPYRGITAHYMLFGIDENAKATLV